MRIAHVITRLIVGGAQENTVASVLGLRRKSGLEVRLLSGHSLGPEGSMEEGLREPPGLLTIIPELVRPVHPLKDWLAFQKLTSWFRDYQPGIVHTHSGKAGILGRLAAARAKVPVIVHTIHGPSFGSFQGRIPNLVFRGAERYAARVTTHFVVVANAMKEQYLAAGIGEQERYTRIFSGFNLNPFLSASNDLKLRAKYGLSPDDLVIGKIARLFELKGHDDLFDIAPSLVRECPKLKFLLVGDGEWRGRFESKARSLGMQEHFVFTGLVRPEGIPSLVGIMDILAHLSFREGLPRALPQALAAGKPVVAYDCDGAKEICLENETGFLVSPGDKLALTRRLLQLTKDSSLRERLGNHGRGFVRQHFGVEQMVDALHSLYLRLRDAQSGRLTSEIAKTGA
jgi:glycosyltransferase involved in cell wall biosynthesis